MGRYNLALFAVLMGLLLSPAEPAGENQNAAEFHTMCQLYDLALSAEKIPNLVDLLQNAAKGDAQEVERIYLVTGNDTVYKLGPDTEESKKLSPDERQKAWNANNPWLSEKVSAQQNNGPLRYPRLENVRIRRELHAKVWILLERARQIAGEVVADAGKSITARDAAIKAINEAVFGEGGSIDRPRFQNAHANACVTAGTGTGVGKSLASDIVCLCAGATDDAASAGGKKCGHHLALDAAGGTGDNYKDAVNAMKAWTKLKAGCRFAERPTTPTPGGIESRLAAFLALLGAQADGVTAEQGNFILGKTNADGACSGDANDKVCVSYKNVFKNGRLEIPWFLKLLEARDELIKQAEAADRAKTAAAKLEHISTVAEAEFKAAVEAETLLEPAPKNENSQPDGGNPGISSDKPTAHETSKVNAAPIPRFILPWALLI